MGRSPFHGRPRISDTWAFSSSTVRSWAGDRDWATAVVVGPASVVGSGEGTLDVVAGGLDGLSSLPQPVVAIAKATTSDGQDRQPAGGTGFDDGCHVPPTTAVVVVVTVTLWRPDWLHSTYGPVLTPGRDSGGSRGRSTCRGRPARPR